MCFVRLLKRWYKEQTMQVKWGKHFSKPFHVSNGIRKGREQSPYLFAVYLDDLSNELNNIKAGCYIGKVLLNLLMFADDQASNQLGTPGGAKCFLRGAQIF